MTNTDNPIEAVRARLDGGRKWHKGALGPDGSATKDGPVCILGACQSLGLNIKRFLYNERTGFLSVVKEQFPERWDASASVVSFNDHPDTTWADVDLVLDKAARAWDEAVR